MKKYIQEKRVELLRKATTEDITAAVDIGYDLIETRMLKKYGEVSPEFVRRVDLLECLLVTFIEHVNNIDALAEIEAKISKNKLLEINVDRKLYC